MVRVYVFMKISLRDNLRDTHTYTRAHVPYASVDKYSRKQFYYMNLLAASSQAVIIRSYSSRLRVPFDAEDRRRSETSHCSKPAVSYVPRYIGYHRSPRPEKERPHRFVARAASCPTAVSPLSSPIHEARVLIRPWCIYHTERTVSLLCARTCERARRARARTRPGDILLACTLRREREKPGPCRVLS